MRESSFKGPAEVSVCVVAHNEVSRIVRCLESIVQQAYPGNFEILVIDNGSTDETSALASGYLSDVASGVGTTWSWRVLRRELNHLGLGRQAAVRWANAPFVAFTDADCVVPTDWLVTLVKGMSASNPTDRSLAGVGSSNRPPLESRFHQTQAIAFTSFIGNFGSEQFRRGGPERVVPHLPTCSVLYDRALVMKVGGFSEHHARVCEDLDLSYRLAGAQLKLLKIPGAEVVHHHQENYFAWAKKIFRYGSGQIEIMRRIPAHRRTKFVLPPSLIFIFPALGFFGMRFIPMGLVFYAIAIALAAFGLGLRTRRLSLAPDLTLFLAVTHFSYGAGMIAGLLEWPMRPMNRVPRA